ncbi:histone RNA hairpin-binding protein [Tetranychus urticae]|uniref:Histone RNA hairpin-binding protein RNA-binding domain-containing protein n=1 Tax=Tetranychus urticae TaxID=32264 RepID=T1KNY7_TETUR|nr:histone RNA hairpin-binding protein [Tetranychus urticae]
MSSDSISRSETSSPVITSVVNILDGVNWADIDSENEEDIWEKMNSSIVKLTSKPNDNSNIEKSEKNAAKIDKNNKCKSEDNASKRPRKRLASETSSSSSTCSSTDIRKCTKRRKKQLEFEEDKQVLNRRSKQIDYGKNTLGYQNYLKIIPKDKRMADDPQTPNKFLKFSRRSWDQQIKLWRKKLHTFDPPEESSEKSDDLDLVDIDMSEVNDLIYALQ